MGDQFQKLEVYNTNKIQQANQAIIAKKVEEKKVDDETARMYFDEQVINEIKYRYNHEKNKIVFMIYVAKIIKYMEQDRCYTGLQ